MRLSLTFPTSATPNGTKRETKVGTFSKGTFISLVQRYVEFSLAAPANPSLDVPEGPYLRIYPASMLDNGVGAWAQPGLQNISWDKAGVQTFLSIDTTLGADGQNDGSGFYYEVDAAQGAIYLPFDCSVSLVSYRNGAFIYDLIAYQDAQFPANFAREYRQTRTFKGNSTRSIWVPAGAKRWQWGSQTQLVAGGATPVWDFEDAPGALSQSADSSFIYNQIAKPVPHARKAEVTPGAATGANYQPSLVFWIEF